jgi:hypothetical protein
MIVLDVCHYCATVLHPKYRSLKSCSKEERLKCHQYIREQIKSISDSSTIATIQQEVESASKKTQIS